MGLFTRSTPVTPKPITPEEQAAIAALPANAPTAESMSVKLASNRTSMVAPAPPSERQLYLQQLKVRLHQQLVDRLDVQNLRTLPPDTVRSEVRVLIKELCQSEKGLINSAEQERLMDEV